MDALTIDQYIMISLNIMMVGLALITVLLALSVIGAIIHFRTVARKHAIEEAERIAEQTANNYIQNNINDILKSYSQMARQLPDDSTKELKSDIKE